MTEIKEYLTQIGIKFKLFEHPPVYTCEDAKKYTSEVRGLHLKNLFLHGKEGSYFLVIIPANEKADLKKISHFVSEKVSLANSNELKDILNLEPGSVSPFGLINDLDNKVKIIIDKKILEQKYLSFHPNTNTKTLELTLNDFIKYLNSLNKKIIAVQNEKV